MRLPTIAGKSLTSKEWPDFTWNADLVEFDGPLVSLYKTDDDADALFLWVDRANNADRWCILEVDREPLNGYLRQEIPLAQLFSLQEAVLMFRTGRTGRRSELQRVQISDLPEAYIPTAESFLYDDIATESARELVGEHTEAHSLLLDKELYLEDITVIPKVVLQLYSFHYGLAYSYREAVRQKMSGMMEKWRGGINAVNIFTGLRSVIPSVHRPRVLEIRYASPGEIKLDLLPSLFEDVCQAIDRIADDDAYRDLEAIYTEAYAYYRAEGLSGFDEVGSQRAAALTQAQAAVLQEFVDRFFEAMGWATHKADFDSLERDPLSKLRVLLAYYRRARQLRPLLRQGKLATPGQTGH